ncbi:MAG: hypothetical protein KA797_09085 [Chitinophagales bacterium]|nr:hypothetical protein [Chitinophagales bacterium]
MNRIILATLLMVFGCQNQADKISVHELTPLTDYYLDQHPQIDTSKVLLSSSYYQFIRLTDSTSTIKWGNKVISNLFGDTIDNFFIEKDRINLKWANEKFIVLGRSGGSDTWFRIILPLTKGANAYFYENLMAMDKENGIVVIEHAFDDSDTVLIAENILTRKRQIIGLDWEKCSSAMNHYCIDSISISKKQLYVEWTLPNKIDEPNAKEIKRIRLDL